MKTIAREGESFSLELRKPESASGFSSIADHHLIIAVFSEGPTDYEVTCASQKWSGKVGVKQLLLVPKGHRMVRLSRRDEYRELTIVVKPELFCSVASEFDLLGEKLAQSFAQVSVVTASTWMHELMHRLLFEAFTCDRGQSLASRFCVYELVKELYYLHSGRAERQVERTSQISDPLVAAAVASIEDDLSREIPVGELAKQLHCSVSTLQRRFKIALKQTPMAYRRQRRLQASYQLLRSGSYSVGDVAFMVGYEDFSAFSAAFKKEYKLLPHTVRSLGED